MPADPPRPQPLYRRRVVTGIGLLDVVPLANPLVGPREVHDALTAHTNAHPEIPIRLVAEEETLRYVRTRESNDPTEGGADALLDRYGWRGLLLLWTPLTYDLRRGYTIADRLTGWASFDRTWWTEHGLAPWEAAIHLSPEAADERDLEAWQDRAAAVGEPAALWSHRVQIDASIDELLRQVLQSVTLARAAIGLAAAAGGEF